MKQYKQISRHPHESHYYYYSSIIPTFTLNPIKGEYSFNRYLKSRLQFAENIYFNIEDRKKYPTLFDKIINFFKKESSQKMSLSDLRSQSWGALIQQRLKHNIYEEV